MFSGQCERFERKQGEGAYEPEKKRNVVPFAHEVLQRRIEAHEGERSAQKDLNKLEENNHPSRDKKS